ncbi:hypothetical protein PISL3812_03454 [Talaromyces islandicus]|uniref:ATP-dependent DNA helicase n=1 Tax=Talaromyces islandicus TaxID=28573 RepID=A0A0U1LST2_TALIS|nr:hypothetical protein PISL3812_03454 [Talaromyces islandicus]
MSDTYSDIDDDNFIVASQSEVVDSQASVADSPRPSKRRRLSNSTRQQAATRLSDDDEYDGLDDDMDSDGTPSLPPRHRYSEDDESDDGYQSKYKIFVPKKPRLQENTFVSQLTQPHSSPSRIRGPRWKKPEPEARQTLTPETSGGPARQDGNDEDDADLRAAIAASLESFEEEGTNQPKTSTVSASATTMTRPAVSQPDGIGFDIDDIPEDAFDSSPCLSPQNMAMGPPPPPAVNRPPPIQRTNLRQTTLFQAATRNPSQVVRSWSPPDRDEPPTHHKLDTEAMQTWVYPTNLGRIRDYQFNITQKGLFHNLLVALPTGLGKTFIAATIMLNWFRWTKTAQIVFVAPTKPLVTQQVSACLGIAGIPRSQTTLLTGNVPPGIRAEEWQTKRIFFMTPQTLTNDLKTGIADPKRIVLLVVDEAHRATGGYAYVEVVKFLRRFNSSFRVLALTATPGSTVEAVQAVIDGLEIARVEIRTEQSLDIREYVHARNVDVQTFTNTEEMLLCMDLLSKALQSSVDQLRSLNAYWGRDPMALTAFGLTKARQQWMASDAGRNAHFGLKGKVNALFTVLASLAHAIDLLKFHGIVPFYRHLVSFRSNTDGQKGGKYQRAIVEEDHFKKLMNHLDPWSKNPEFIGHPKLGYLREIVLNHFMDAGEGKDLTSPSNTRIMIFAHFRDSAEEITRVLKRHEPIIRPHVFVGQASAKGSEGMDQKKQLSVVEKFKSGTYNTIVATSIGEEGLDIGEVDLIVCYDSSASPIRMLQRMGRTGRKRAGNIVLLLMQGKEEESYIKAKDNYEKMQELIASGARFAFHDDQSARILPKGVKPDVDKREVDIPPENSQQELPEPKKKGRAPKRPPKKFHMPDDVETGFTTASRIGEARGNADIRTMVKKKPKKNASTPPTPKPAEIPRTEEVVLTPQQESELDFRYRNVGGTTPQFIRGPRKDAFPRLQRTLRPTKLIAHGSLTRRMVNTFKKMDATRPNCEMHYDSVLDEIRQRASTLPIQPSNTAHKPAKKALLPTSSNSTTIFPSPNRKTDRSSPLMCSPYPGPDPNDRPFYVSQVSNLDDVDHDFPDLETLARQINKPDSPKKTRKRPRRVIEDDDDDDDDF